MRTTPSLLVAAAVLSPLASGLTLAARSLSPKVVGLDIQRRSIPDRRAHDRLRFAKRAGTVSEILNNEATLYFANVTLGTPAQSLQVHLDTGSSDMWVNTANSTFCQSSQNHCIGGYYDAGSSSTYKFVNNDFNISYVDGTSSTGVYGTDTLVFASQTLSGFQFGVGDTSSSAEGVLGIGYTVNEVQVNRAQGQPYPNLPEALVNAGVIETNAYSLWLNDLDASTGTVLFGGVNSAKYSGTLSTLPILTEDGTFAEFIIAMTGLTLSGQALSSSSLPAAVLLDSGTTLTYLPNDLTQQIYTQLDAVYEQQEQTAYVNCSLQSSSATVVFSFSGVQISVDMSELLLGEATDSNGNPLNFQNGQAACIFGISPADGSTAVLGDTFLRSAYLVYDLTNNEISLAQTIFNSTGDNIQQITKSDNGAVPGASAVASPVTTVVAGTGGARIGGATATATGFGSSSTPKSSGHRSQLPSSLVALMAAMVVAVLM